MVEEVVVNKGKRQSPKYTKKTWDGKPYITINNKITQQKEWAFMAQKSKHKNMANKDTQRCLTSLIIVEIKWDHNKFPFHDSLAKI
jgi:hypothetical protein